MQRIVLNYLTCACYTCYTIYLLQLKYDLNSRLEN